MQTIQSSPFRKAVPWVLFVTLMFTLNYMARTILSPILLPMEQELAIGHALGTRLLIFQAIGFCIAQLCCGFWLARIRPYQMVSLSIIVTGLCLITNVFTTSYWQVALCFGGMGLAAGLYFPAGMATLTSLVSTNNWGKAVAMHELAPNTCFILLPALTQIALTFTNWRGVCGILGTFIVLCGCAFALFAQGGRDYAMKPSLSGYRDLMSNRLTWIFAMLLSAAIIGEFSTFSILPAYFVTELDISQEKANNLLSLTRILCPFAALCGGWLADRFAPIQVSRFYLLSQAVTLFAMGSSETMVVLLATTLQCTFTALTFPSIFKLIALSFPIEQQPVLYSFTVPMAVLLGTGLAPQMLGYCGDSFGFALGFAILGFLNILFLYPLRNLGDIFVKSK